MISKIILNHRFDNNLMQKRTIDAGYPLNNSNPDGSGYAILMNWLLNMNATYSICFGTRGQTKQMEPSHPSELVLIISSKT